MNADCPEDTDATTAKRFGGPGPKGIIHRVLLILAVAILAVSVLYAGSRPVDAKDKVATLGSKSSVAVSSPHSAVTREEAERALEYWTPKRMASATPAPLPKGSRNPKAILDQPLPPNSSPPPARGAAPVPPADHTDKRLHQGAGPEAITPASHTTATRWTGPSTRPPATTTGKLFFLVDPNTPSDPRDDFDSSCSASTVNSAAKNLVFTAGHCLLDIPKQGDNDWSHRVWKTDIVYVPANFGIYRPTTEHAPYGVWAAREAVVTKEWENSRDWGYDLGAVLLWPSELTGGERLVDVVGANGIRFNEPAEQDAHIFGYPENHQNGAVLNYCHDQSKWGGILNPKKVWAICDFSYGSSGGPWLMNFNGELGDLFSVTSGKCLSIKCDQRGIEGPLFEKSERKLYEDIVGADFRSPGIMVFTRHDGEDFEIYKKGFGFSRQLTSNNLATDINPSYTTSIPTGGLAYESNQGDTSGSTSDYEIYTTNLDDTGPTNQVTNNTEDDRDPSYAPNGDHIAYEGYDGNDYEIYMTSVIHGKPTGERPIQVTDNTVEDRDPSFSPSSGQIAYTSLAGEGSDYEIYKINVRGGTPIGTPIQVTHNFRSELDPTYSPDSKWIAFSGSIGGDYEIFKVLLSENPEIFHEPIQITYNDTGDRKPSYSRDGYHIVYHSYDGNDYELYTINLIFGHVLQLTQNTTDDCCPYWGGSCPPPSAP
jgi:hypothetical protein